MDLNMSISIYQAENNISMKDIKSIRVSINKERKEINKEKKEK